MMDLEYLLYLLCFAVHITKGKTQPNLFITSGSTSINSGETLHLTCKDNQIKNINVTVNWYKGSNKILFKKDSTNFIRNVTKDDTSSYTCGVTSDNITRYSNTVNITVNYITNAQLVGSLPHPKDKDRFIFICIADTNLYEVTYTFNKSDQVLQSSRKPTYVFENLIPNDTGKYTCRVNVGTLKTTSSTYDLEILGSRKTAKRASLIVAAGVLPGLILIFVIMLCVPKCCAAKRKRKHAKRAEKKKAKVHKFPNANTTDSTLA